MAKVQIDENTMTMVKVKGAREWAKNNPIDENTVKYDLNGTSVGIIDEVLKIYDEKIGIWNNEYTWHYSAIMVCHHADNNEMYIVYVDFIPEHTMVKYFMEK